MDEQSKETLGVKEEYFDEQADAYKVVFNSGLICYYKDGLRHRLDGPAVEHTDGVMYWYKSGKLHRLDGPAIYQGTEGHKWYYIDGHIYYNMEQYKYDALIYMLSGI